MHAHLLTAHSACSSAPSCLTCRCKDDPGCDDKVCTQGKQRPGGAAREWAERKRGKVVQQRDLTGETYAGGGYRGVQWR